jgi:hypothetical protein
MTPRKFKIHFNRINMQRGNPNIWTVHWADRCIQAEEIQVNGTIATVYRPEGRQPRAWFEGKGVVKVKGGIAFVTSC